MNYTGLGNKLREYLLGTMLLLLTTLGWGRQQNYYFETIGREEGLSHGMVYGFSSSSYFSKCFYKQFGVLPKDVSKDTDIPDKH